MEWKVPPLSLIYLLVVCPSAQALLSNNAKASLPSGFSIAAGLGLTSFMTSTTSNTSAATIQKTANNTNNRYGMLGNFALGYNRNYRDRYYLGGEFGVNLLGARKTTLDSIIQNRTTVSHDLDIAIVNSALSTATNVSEKIAVPVLDIKPGLFLNPNTLVFARVGMSFNTMDLNASSSYQSDGNVQSSGSRTSASTLSTFYNATTKQTIGLRTGLGFEYLITDKLGLSANYIFTGYNGVQLNGSQPSNQIACDTFEGCSVDKNGVYTTTQRSTVSVQDVMLQLIYHMA